MPPVTCILCGTSDYERELYPSNVTEADLTTAVFSARRAPDRLHGRVVRCIRCGLVYANPQVERNLLADLYDKSTYTYAEEERYICRTYTRYLRRLLPILRDQPRPLSYLDIGCGNGFMLRAARAIGFDDAWGVEPSTHAATAAAAPEVSGKIMHGMFAPELLGGKRFDAISCFQTLDHIPDPAAFVRECAAALRPGGAVLFINHNIASFTARLLGERCPMIDIEHTYLHTPATMRLLFERAGFTDTAVFAVRNDYPIHYWAHLMPGPAKLKQPVIAWLRRNRIGSIILPLYAGNLGLIGRKAG